MATDRRITFRICAPQARAIRLAAGDIPGVGGRAAPQLTKAWNGVRDVTIGGLGRRADAARAFDKRAALQTGPAIAAWGRRIFEGQPAVWPVGTLSNEEHRAVTAWPEK